MDTAPPVTWHDAFYKFVRVADVRGTARVLRELTQHLLGSIVVAGEGINGTLAGPAAALDRLRSALVDDARLGGVFAGIRFKRSACSTAPFQRMKVHCKPEIVQIGLPGIDAVGRSGLQLGPLAWRELIADDDLVLIDNRNSFEYRLGHFRNAIDPQVRHFRDFPAFIEARLPQWVAKRKQVAMYCTGGIRCEKSAAWLHDRGLPVYQLEGGVLNYFEQMPDAERDWQGECFVFDNRMALDTRLQEAPTTAEQVYAGDPAEAWRLRRARQLAFGG